MSNTFLIQLISAKDGRRSDPFGADIDQLREMLQMMNDENNDDYVLMVGMQQDEGDFQITKTPLITVAELRKSIIAQRERHERANSSATGNG